MKATARVATEAAYPQYREERMNRTWRRTNETVRVLGNSFYAIYRMDFSRGTYDMINYKTKFGLRMRACGEHPAACDTLGINVLGIRFFSVCMSGFLAGLGGASVTMATMNQFRPTSIVGQGFIAIAAVIFGKFRPQGAMWACLLFGMCSGLKIVLGSSNVVSAQLISMIPFVVTVIVLILFVGRSQVPAANGKPYIKSK